MTPSYPKMLELTGLIDSKLAALSAFIEKESKNKQQLAINITDVKKYISVINDALSALSGNMGGSLSVEATEQQIQQFWGKLRGASSVSEYISESRRLGSLYSSTYSNSQQLKKEQEIADVQIKHIKEHKSYRTWVQNSDKLNFDIIPGAMPSSLSGYTSEAIDLLVAYSAKVLWEPYKRYMYYYLYVVYKNEIHATNQRLARIKQFDEIHASAEQLIPIWIKELNNELSKQKKKLQELESTYDAFDKDSDKRINKLSSDLESEIIRQHNPNDLNAWMTETASNFTDWREVYSKEDISTEEKESFTLATYHGIAKTRVTENKYFTALSERLVKHYSTIFSIQGDLLAFTFPLLFHLDTLHYRFSTNINGAIDSARSGVNGFVQEVVSSVIANMPVGKAKFIFSDPGNTGVFSNFRDVGKNELEGSRLSTYIVDVDGIRRELERLSNEIGYTINNILKGTKTTLYQHNKERAFNSSPYVFVFLMDYPQNMTAQSLQALKNIVENGPKCGIFTFIFNVGGTSMELLRPEERKIAEEIAKADFTYRNSRLCDSFSSWLNTESEISTVAFDQFVKHYNEAIKESQQLTVYLDELEGSVCQNGDYKIPIGKNLGGETEYMSFFGSCQDYLMSGATRIGKTNALHVIIYNTLKYVPNAELYLVDFKQGVEFAPYAGLNHPVIKALAVESVPEFGYAVLRHIEDKIKAISELFISNSVKNWKEYYNATGKVIPVTIIILDEFQHLFDTDVGKDCARIIEVIAKEGGAFNVHVILSTQSISNVNGLTAAAKDNIFGRMVFYHSENEYSSMLWGDTHLALTLSSEVKGQMVFATGDKTSQRLLQFAMAKSVTSVVKELGRPFESGRYPTKLLLSTIRENPFSIFNAIINGKYQITDPNVYEITIGNEVDVFSGELRKQLETGETNVTDRYAEKSYLKLVKKPNENILFVGNNESIAEACFQLSIYCALAQAILLGRTHSIIVIAPEVASKLTSICETFGDYIDYYDQESDLSEITLENKDFMFVFGLQNFRSLSYQPDTQLLTARTEVSRPRMPGGIPLPQASIHSGRTDGQLLQQAVESETVHVVAWHNNVQNLQAMFGDAAKIQDFLYCFAHKVGFKMSDKNDSRTFINSETCVGLSEQAAIYVKMNKERIIRPYKAMDSGYCAKLNDALKALGG